MKGFALALAGLGVFVAFLAWAPSVEASGNCGHGTGSTGNWCEGWASTGTNVQGLGSLRCFDLRATNSAPTCPSGTNSPTSPEANWQVDAGGCQAFYWFQTTNGATPPAAPNKLTLEVRYDNSGTVILNWLSLSTTIPANGDSFTICGTSNGLPGGSPRAGTMRLFINAVKDDGALGVGNYNVNSDGGGGAQVSHFDKGAVISRMVVASVARSAYPSGSTFAYGASGDESIAITSTFTQPFADAGIETMRNFIADEATLVTAFEVGATVDVDAVTTLVQSFVADGTFTFAGNPYVAGVQLRGLSLMTGQTWSLFASAGHGGDIVTVPTSAYASTDFNIDSRIGFDADGSGAADGVWPIELNTCAGAAVSVLNKGETVCGEGYLLNARGEQLTRSMTISREDATPTTCATAGSIAPTAGLYSWTATLATGAVCTTTADTIGAARYFRATNTDQSSRSNQLFNVSSLLFVDSHLQISPTLVQDSFPDEDAAEDFTFTIRGDGMGGDASDTIHLWCQAEGVRQDTAIDTSGNNVQRAIRDPLLVTRAGVENTDTGSDGWTPTSLNLLSSTPLGQWRTACTATHNGNLGLDVDFFNVTVEGGGNGTIENYMADPLKIYAVYDPVDSQIRAIISASYLDGTARVGAASEINVTVWDHEIGEVVSYDNPIELGLGSYYYNYTPLSGGIFTVRANTTDPTSGEDIGTGNDVLVRGNNTLELTTMSDFAGLGFDGFLILLLWLAAALFFVLKDWAFSLAFTIPGILQTLFPDQIPGEFALYLLLAFLGVIMQFFVGDRQRFSLHGKKKATGA